MTKAYTERLIRLAQELVELREWNVFSAQTKNDVEVDAAMHGMVVGSKIDFLLGYILALEEYAA